MTAGRLGALAGVGFALCFFVGVAMLDIPHDTSDRELVAWWSDRGHQATAIVSMYLFVLAGLCFLVFLAALRSRLLAAAGGRNDLTAIVGGAGVVFVSMLFVAAAARGAIAFAVRSPANDERLPGPDALRYLPQVGYAITGTGGVLAAALVMAATSLLIARTAVFGRWLAWLGAVATLVVVVASVLLSGVLAIPALLVWSLAASAAMWVRPANDRNERAASVAGRHPMVRKEA
jgi:hypothetical protein